jgi:MFS transporter, DHA2 family, methylenomycin A resistance protein
MKGSQLAPERAQDRRAPLVLLVMCAGMFLVLLDVTVVNVAVPAITAGLRTDTAGVQWVVDGYVVALASLLLGGGTLGDRFGHRQVVLAGLAVFGAASAGCALAPWTGALVAARVVQGVGAALLLPGSIAAIADAYPDRASQARAALGIWAGVSSLALPAGPLLGGFIVQTFGWRAVFWINPPIVTICAIGVLAWVAASRRRPRELDVAGLGLVSLGLAAAVYAVISAGGGGSPVTVVISASVAAVAVIGFIVAEARAETPALPLSLFTVPAFCAANGASLLMNLTSNGLLFLLTRYLQSVLGHSALAAGLMLLPLFVPLTVLAPLAGRLSARHGARPVMFAGAAIAGLGQLGLLAVTPTAGYARLLPALLGVGLGLGLFAAPAVAAAIRAVPAGQSGLASGVNNTARQVGTALGVAVYGAVAGSPAHTQHFVAVIRGSGVAAAAAWVVVMLVTAIGISGSKPGTVRDNRSSFFRRRSRSFQRPRPRQAATGRRPPLSTRRAPGAPGRRRGRAGC